MRKCTLIHKVTGKQTYRYVFVLLVPRREYVHDRFQFPTRRQPHSVFGAFVHAGTICLFLDPLTSIGHPGSFTSMHELKFMRTQTVFLFNVPRRIHGATTRGLHPYPHCTCPSRGLNPGGCVGRPEC